ncbi:hypothetical protein ACL02T_21995 [Pseudonocardia sp. RS010]|uniref:hypothetical protein n=1 Tax=Pseudonocardia sp. RS010 TaxID=3385979 RepID=UPI0039A3DA18
MSATRPDRCEVCRTPLSDRPDPRRRRCADHLGQAVLFPLTAVTTRPRRRKETRS